MFCPALVGSDLLGLVAVGPAEARDSVMLTLDMFASKTRSLRGFPHRSIVKIDPNQSFS